MEKEIKPNIAITVRPMESGTSGSGMSLSGLVKTLIKEQGYNVILLTTQPAELIAGVRHIRLKKFFGFYFLEKSIHIDYLHVVPFTWRYSFLILNKRYKKHTTIHGFASLEVGNNLVGKVHDLLVRRLLIRYIDDIYTVSCHSKDYIKKLYGRDAHVLYNGVDAYFPVKSPRDIVEVKSLSNVILHVSNFSHRKNPEFICAVIDELERSKTNAKFVIVGNGWKDSFVAKKYLTNDAVDVRGFVSESELQELFIQARVFMFPSLYEGFGMPNLEAMASGSRVVTSRTGSIPEILGIHGTSLEFDVSEWGKTIRDMLLRPYTLKEVLDRQAYVKSYSWERMCKSYTNTISR